MSGGKNAAATAAVLLQVLGRYVESRVGSMGYFQHINIMHPERESINAIAEQ